MRDEKYQVYGQELIDFLTKKLLLTLYIKKTVDERDFNISVNF